MIDSYRYQYENCIERYHLANSQLKKWGRALHIQEHSIIFKDIKEILHFTLRVICCIEHEGEMFME